MNKTLLIKPWTDKILVKLVKEDVKSKSGLVISDANSSSMTEYAGVIAVGEQGSFFDAELPSDIDFKSLIGKEIVFRKDRQIIVEKESEITYSIIDFSDVLGVVNDK